MLIAGNHDYLKSTSYYRNYKWQGPVHMFLSQKPACMEFKELGVRIYGLSYEEREITEPLYEKILPEKRGIASILLAHGGDEKHIPFRKNELLKLGYDYIALGHIHLPAELAVRTYKVYGDKTMDLLYDDPYLLMEDGLDAAFSAVDRFAIDLGIAGGIRRDHAIAERRQLETHRFAQTAHTASYQCNSCHFIVPSS